MSSARDRGPILVTGGTGTLRRLVVPRLLAAGRRVRVLSRHAREPLDGVEHVVGDLDKDEGIAEAVAGAGVVLHLAGAQRGDEVKAEHLVRAARAAGEPQIVFVSVVGADRVPVVSRVDRGMFGYYAAKRGAEERIAGSGLAWTTLRATQFHQLVLTMVEGLSKLPVVPVPAGIRFQPIDADEVAARLVQLTLGEPLGLVTDMGGPRVHELRELARSYLHARGRHRLVVPVRPPGGAAAAMRDGANLAPGRAVGRLTWEEFLTNRFA